MSNFIWGCMIGVIGLGVVGGAVYKYFKEHESDTRGDHAEDYSRATMRCIGSNTLIIELQYQGK